MAKTAQTKYKMSDFEIRPARANDYDGVVSISPGLYWGTDTLPAMYHQYLKDPTRVFYVALYQNQLVSLLKFCSIGCAFFTSSKKTFVFHICLLVRI